MPIYEYRCPNCGVFEILQPLSADDLELCPDCGNKIKRLISRSAVIYNCSGFYCTDYSKGNSPNQTCSKGTCGTGSGINDKKENVSKSEKTA